MKLRVFFLLLSLLVLTYFSIIKPSDLLKPFNTIKDLFFSPVHAINSELQLSNDMKDSQILDLKNDIMALQKLNNLTISISDYDTIKATVIERNKEYWFNNLIINVGSGDGVKVDMAVIDSDGLIGRISSVTKNTSIVKLLTTSDTKNKISAVIHDNEDIYGIINGYDTKNNLLSLIITDNKEIKKNSKVETTGMGGVFPSGILIGRVHDTIKKEDGVTNVVRVIPSGNVEGERYVMVLSRKSIPNS